MTRRQLLFASSSAVAIGGSWASACEILDSDLEERLVIRPPTGLVAGAIAGTAVAAVAGFAIPVGLSVGAAAGAGWAVYRGIEELSGAFANRMESF